MNLWAEYGGKLSRSLRGLTLAKLQAGEVNMVAASPYVKAAAILGWHWSAAHGGLTNGSERRSGVDRNLHASYTVASDAEDACFISGIESESDATKLIRDHA